MPSLHHLAAPPRPLLRDFEHLHAQWLAATTAADALEHQGAGRGAQQLLAHRLAADRLHRKAMQLLRDRPL